MDSEGIIPEKSDEICFYCESGNTPIQECTGLGESICSNCNKMSTEQLIAIRHRKLPQDPSVRRCHCGRASIHQEEIYLNSCIIHASADMKKNNGVRPKTEESTFASLRDKENPLKKQVGGGHYKELPIQPVEYCQKNGLLYCESIAIRYISRHRYKGGLQDIKKAIHCLELLIQLEYTP